MRKIRYERILCQWAVSGHAERVYAFVFEVEGYDRPWFLVTIALDLSGEQVRHFEYFLEPSETNPA